MLKILTKRVPIMYRYLFNQNGKYNETTGEYLLFLPFP